MGKTEIVFRKDHFKYNKRNLKEKVDRKPTIMDKIECYRSFLFQSLPIDRFVENDEKNPTRFEVLKAIRGVLG